MWCGALPMKLKKNEMLVFSICLVQYGIFTNNQYEVISKLTPVTINMR